MEAMDSRPIRRSVLALVTLAALAGCGDAVPPELAAKYAERQAHSATLENASDQPVIWEGETSGRHTLAPGDSVTNGGGVFGVPKGWTCIWHDKGSNVGVTVIGGSGVSPITWTSIEAHTIIESCVQTG